MHGWVKLSVWLLVGLPFGQAMAEDGVTADRIRFGQVAALSGPNAAMGQGLRGGIEIAFAEANARGGVHGHRLDLVARDDGYEPERTTEELTKLLESHDIFALVGTVGTPTAIAALPLLDRYQVPLIGPLSGAEALRAPFRAEIVNVRASYFEEARTIVDHLVEDLGITRIGVFRQNDSFGEAGQEGLRRALAARHLSLAGKGGYERNTTNVQDAFAALSAAKPEAVVIVGAYKPAGAFIRLCRQRGFEPVFVSLSFVDSDAFAFELGTAGGVVYVTQTVPFPADTRTPIVAAYQAAVRTQAGNAGKSAQMILSHPRFVWLEGYIVGREVIAALERVHGEPTRARFLDAIYGVPDTDLGGFDLSYGPGDNRGSHRVFLTMIDPAGSFREITQLTRSGTE
jgi:ABC-type branched-subunit amino acid transport system substrate-binding protein